MATRPRHAAPRVITVLAVGGAALVALPLVALIVRAPWADAWSVLTSEEALTALRLSIEVSLLAALGSVVLGAPLG